MFVVDIGGCDIVLGVEWLRALGPVTIEFKELYMGIVKDSHNHTLEGIQAIPPQVISFCTT